MVLQGYEPAAVWAHFEALSAIPRGSYNEQAAAAYVAAFAEKLGLYCVVDKVNNVFIKKPASPGCEDQPAVMLQGHLDMVCEKNEDVEHDFLTDPIEMYVDGDWIKARGTTLGADNGLACAMMMAILEDNSLVHPPLECLFTAAEETGMDGAMAFDAGLSAAKTLINMDAGPDDMFVVSCAGGMTLYIDKRYTVTDAVGEGLRIAVTGLTGGHSGTNIHRGRGNANRIMGRLLDSLGDRARLSEIRGGSKNNAIPREAFANIVVPSAEEAIKTLSAMAAVLKSELTEADEAFAVSIEPVSAEKAMSRAETEAVTALLCLLPEAVLNMSQRVPGLVETSANIGVVRTENGAVSIELSCRGSVESRQEETLRRVVHLCRLVGADLKQGARYSGWEYDPASPVRKTFEAAYRDLFGREATAKAIHAGLECGLFAAKMPGLDIVAIGAECHGGHSPAERANIPSTARVYELVKEVLRRMGTQA